MSTGTTAPAEFLRSGRKSEGSDIRVGGGDLCVDGWVHQEVHPQLHGHHLQRVEPVSQQLRDEGLHDDERGDLGDHSQDGANQGRQIQEAGVAEEPPTWGRTRNSV